MQGSFDSSRLDHWLVVVAYMVLSGWIVWKVYLKG
jgi:hypothetical protein